MVVVFSEYFANSSVLEAVLLYWNTVQVYLTDTASILTEIQGLSALTLVQHLPEFDEFQCNLLKVFLTILFLNIILIFAAWRYYGKDISERFMKLSTNQEIEELKASVAKLKLPKEHTPRI